MNNRPKIKICCIKSREEMNITVDYGVDYIGFVSNMPSGPGIISEQKIRNIVQYAPSHIKTVLLTSLTDPKAIAKQQSYCEATALQLCSPMNIRDIEKARNILQGIWLIKVIHVRGQYSIKEAIEVQNFVDAILLDSGDPYSVPPKLGGTGKVHNWKFSKEICRLLSIPVFLAGGLNHENVRSALESVNPYGIDVCNGVRTNDKLDVRKLKLLLEAVNE